MSSMIARKIVAVFLVLALATLAYLQWAYSHININVGSFRYGGREEGETGIVRTSPPPHVSSPGTSSFKRYSLAKGVEEIARVWGRAPPLPKWLPDNMTYAEAYTEPAAIVCYSDRPVEDFRFADVTIEIHLQGPSEEELKQEVENSPYLKLVKAGDVWVVMNEKAHSGWIEEEEAFGPSPLAWFSKDGFYYMVGVHAPLTPQDLVKVIESMKPPS